MSRLNITEKPCVRCNTVKSVSEFRIRKDKHGEKVYLYYNSYCKACVYQERKERLKNQKFKDQINFTARLRRNNLRNKIIQAYGGKCTCPNCPETNPAFLTIEHLNNDGAKHRKLKNGDLGVYVDIVKNNFPPNYTILCHNCNCGKWKSKNNVCPHISMDMTVRDELLEEARI